MNNQLHGNQCFKYSLFCNCCFKYCVLFNFCYEVTLQYVKVPNHIIALPTKTQILHDY